eukprot:1196351-Prorocentrum_minimum.AAC.8
MHGLGAEACLGCAPDSYNDNVFNVLVRHGDFEGPSVDKYQQEEGTYLPQDPASLEYRTANTSKQVRGDLGNAVDSRNK